MAALETTQSSGGSPRPQSLRFLYAIYRKETYLWDIWEMIQKLILTGLIGLIFPGKDLQVVVVVLFDLFSFAYFYLTSHIMGPFVCWPPYQALR